MKILIVDTSNVVIAKVDTNITDPNDTGLIDVGGLGVHLVNDDDARVVGEPFGG